MCPVACYRLIAIGGHSKSGPQGGMLICKGFKKVLDMYRWKKEAGRGGEGHSESTLSFGLSWNLDLPTGSSEVTSEMC